MAKNVSSKFDLDSGLFREKKVPQPANEDISWEHMPWDVSSNPAELGNGHYWGEGVEAAARKMSEAQNNPDNLSSLYSPSDISKPRPLGCTQGRKGQKAKRINMAFGDEIHAYITHESRRRGMNATQFVNMVLAMYKDSPEGKID